ncbi:SRPBCC domain-containing protein [Geojedonia litorea]|uniref:SRPBCC domain-containing protein n=1 Tax=Geojedonia litorea TaxID=1268269 RepID=A0ABV9N0T0_9FLAO
METLQWSRFEKQIYIHTSVEKLYQLWATKSGITSWFLSKAVYISKDGTERDAHDYIQAGDSYSWFWHNWDGQEDGKIIQANGKDFLQLTFGNSILDITLKALGNVTLVILNQHDIPEDEDSKLKIFYGCSNGWTFWLTNLKAYVEHGILLNETEINLKENKLSDYVFVNM